MPLGPSIRKLIGPSLAPPIGRAYRNLFVNLDKVARALTGVLPPGAHVLDIGGGDGEPLNHLLELRDDLRVTTIDPGPQVGQWIAPRFAERVTCLPGTGIEEYLAQGRTDPDAVVIADVMHHIPVASRPAFFASLKTLWDRNPDLRIIVKDVEPGSPRALLGLWSDRYITGDRGVSLVSRRQIVALMEAAIGPLRHEETPLHQWDSPNYAIAFFR